MSWLAGAGRRIGRLRLRDVVIPTAPVLLALGFAVGAAMLDYARAQRYDDWWSNGVRLNEQLRARIGTALALPRFTAVRERLDPAVDDPYAIRLMVDRDLWDAQVADIQQRDWVDATLAQEGNRQGVEVRRRGDTSVHWTTPKISMTVRAPRGEQIRGFRELALTGKTVLESHIAHTIAADYGMPVPLSRLAPVYLNERYYGLFRAVEPIDESYLRRTGRMPGDIFRADRAERGEYFKNIPRNVFWNPYIWDRVAELNDPGQDPFDGLHGFLTLVNETSLESHLALMERLDRDEIARLFAVTLTVGDPYHMSGVHNQYWFEDPATGTLHPIPWDLRLRGIEDRPTNPLNPFFVAALRDPFLPDAVLEAIHGQIEAGLVERVGARIDSLAGRFGPHLEFERLREGLVSPPGTPAEVVARVRRNLETLTEWIEDARLGFAATRSPDPRGPVILDVEVRGRAGVELTELAVPESSGPLALWADSDRDGRLGDGDRRVAATIEEGDGETRVVLERPLALRPAWDTADWRIVPGRVHYRLFLAGAGTADVRMEVANAVTGGSVDVREVEPGAALGGTAAFHAWRFPVPEAEEVVLSGQVALDEDLRIDSEDRLVIAAGTTVRLDPDVSILARGRVEARGAPGRPIRFLPSDPELPWGAIALQGPGASGSVFEHVELRHGGGARLDGVAYKGMLSVYGARDVTVRDATFADNLRSDDAFNAVYSEVRLEHCRFSNANADAVDFDYSSGSITSCTFEDSRNDAIDLMTSTPLIRSNRMLRSGDKGVSIGEASEPILIDNHIRGAERGIEIKDRSDPIVLHTSIEGTNIGILGQVKNWRYGGGGRGLIILTRLTDNGTDVTLDPESRLAILRSQIGSDPLDAGAEGAPGWVSAAYGLAGVPPRPGAIGGGWPGGAIRGPLYELRFDREQPFYEEAVGWTVEGNMRLRHRDRALRGAVERGPGVWRLPIAWEAAGPAELTVELTGRDLVAARVILESESDDVTAGLTLPDSGRVSLITVPVPPGRYEAIRFEAEADPAAVWIDPETGLGERRGGRLDVYRVRLWEIGSPSGSPTATPTGG